MSITAQAIQAALTKLVDPNTHKDYVTSRSAKNIKIDGGSVSLDIVLGYPAKSLQETVRQQIEEALLAVEGVKKVAVTVSSEIAVHSVQQNLKPLGKIKNIIAVTGTQNFLRIKVGVGEKPAGWDLADHVLGHFDTADRAEVEKAIGHAVEAAEMMITGETDAAMNRYNVKKKEE